MNSEFDLHMHSTASDGSDAIPVLWEKIRQSGIRVFSVTDHDTIAGTLEMEKLVAGSVVFIRGVEFSCVSPMGKSHILGYGFDPEDAILKNALESVRTLRANKLANRLKYLKEAHGIMFTDKELQWLHAQTTPGKPHMAQILVKRGLAKDMTDAIHGLLSFPDGEIRIDAHMAIKAILHAGGAPVWAHPLGGEGEPALPESEFFPLFEELLSFGIRGLECYYSRYTQEQVAFLLAQASARGLYVTGGSDYHGANKKNIHLGKLNSDSAPIGLSSLFLAIHRKFPTA